MEPRQANSSKDWLQSKINTENPLSEEEVKIKFKGIKIPVNLRCSEKGSKDYLQKECRPAWLKYIYRSLGNSKRYGWRNKQRKWGHKRGQASDTVDQFLWEYSNGTNTTYNTVIPYKKLHGEEVTFTRVDQKVFLENNKMLSSDE